MWKRLAVLTTALWMLCGTAMAELNWPKAPTEGQQAAAAYIAQVNEDLAAQGMPVVNTLFECYTGFASLGVTADPKAEVPEDVELILTMDGSGLTMLTLRVSDAGRFAALAGACIHAATPDLALTDALREPTAYAARVMSEPDNSFEDDVDPSQGDTVRVYYRYAPDEYHDGVDWITMTLIFPWHGAAAGGVYVTPTPPPAADYGNEYEGSQFDDGYTHFEVFVTPTTNPDDALI